MKSTQNPKVKSVIGSSRKAMFSTVLPWLTLNMGGLQELLKRSMLVTSESQIPDPPGFNSSSLPPAGY